VYPLVSGDAEGGGERQDVDHYGDIDTLGDGMSPGQTPVVADPVVDLTVCPRDPVDVHGRAA